MKTLLIIAQSTAMLLMTLMGSTAYAASPGNAVVNINEASFSCIRQMTPVRHFYVDNVLGNIDATLAAANAPEGAIYPTGSVVQLVPTEVMVKREPGTSPVTGDWEFFELEVDETGSKIAKRGFIDVNNRFGGNCFACHLPAKEKWDFICESGHGCEPIPIDHKMTGALQRSDPRCGEPALESGDTMALFKLKVMVSLGTAKKWFEDLF
ncbi:hypothetical protein [Shewanella holmiensis]|uniref:Cytochrome P460 domain-containing protein n=1 Tax=Shewanella holmiensis TaxID=2952222 RepID=A0A9X3APS1_9GAMM|nr:hypothetical protein [Shewanella holmiensis]MCT7942617.1 hypothetical protein [Shewanella holmiensis]